MTCSVSASSAIQMAIPASVSHDPLMRPLLITFGVGQLVLGLLLWLTPGFFYDEIGPYPPRNDHYMADLATFYLALGAGVSGGRERRDRAHAGAEAGRRRPRGHRHHPVGGAGGGDPRARRARG